MLKSLNADRFTKPPVILDPGPVPMLEWLEIGKLVVDQGYQRAISRRGAANIEQIAAQFDWSKFAPVIVAPVVGGMFAVVDGQHRTTAAMLCGIEKVPCQIVQADRAQQAAAYAAVNGNVTKITYTQLFHARMASGDPGVEAISAICAAADVAVVKTNTPTSLLKAGQTSAINALTRCYKRYGEQVLLPALRCVTRTADGNPGFLRATVIEALCTVLHENPAWRASESALLKHMNDFSFPAEWHEITAGRGQFIMSAAKAAMMLRLKSHLSRGFSRSERLGKQRA